MSFIKIVLYAATYFAVFFAYASLWTLPVQSANILAIETVAGNSHWNFVSSVLRALTDNGHNVTVFTPITDGNRENYTEIDTSKDFPRKFGVNLEDMMKMFSDPIKVTMILPAMSRSYCNMIHGNEKLQEMLQGNVQTDFDVILIEPIWMDCMSYIAIKLNIPVIYLVAHPMVTFIERSLLGHAPNPAVVTHIMAPYVIPKTFTQRLTSTAMMVFSSTVMSCSEMVFKYIDPKPYDTSISVKPSALFVNTHYITDVSRPVLSNVIHVGGMHLKAPKNIPNDILEFIEDSPHGVIYFTFGSVVKMSTLPKHIQKAFKDALAQVPQRVLWKYEGEMEDKPKNVMTKEWFPQREILLHPKVKLFISHGGISGVYEAVDAGVPVLGFPLFYDQPRNVDNLVEAGMAISMDLMTVTKDPFLKAVLELINNKEYTINAQIASKSFKDRPMSPEQSVVYWTEYVIRHKGAAHLKSHALNLTWYQYYLLDVIGFTLVLISAVFFVIYKMYKCVLKYFYSFKAKSD